MKKLTLIAVLLGACTATINAQENSGDTDNREKFLVGIKAGVNRSNVYDSQGEEFKSDAKFGMVGGAFMEIPVGKYLGIHPEVLISQKGFQATGRVLGGSYSFTRTTTYLDIPLQVSLKPSEFITIVAGPQYSYLLHQRDVFTNASTSIAQEQEFENDEIRKNIFGVVGGVDINLKHIVLGGRVGWDVQNNNGDGTSTTPRYKNVWYQATIGYKLYK